MPIGSHCPPLRSCKNWGNSACRSAQTVSFSRKWQIYESSKRCCKKNIWSKKSTCYSQWTVNSKCECLRDLSRSFSPFRFRFFSLWEGFAAMAVPVRRIYWNVTKCCPNSLNFDEMLSCSLNFDAMLDRFCPCSTGRRTARCSRAAALCSTRKKRSFVKSSLKTKLKWYTRSRQERRPD